MPSVLIAATMPSDAKDDCVINTLGIVAVQCIDNSLRCDAKDDCVINTLGILEAELTICTWLKI